MGKEYLICFHQDGKATFYNDGGSNGDTITFKENQLIKVSEMEMFQWLEKAHQDTIKIEIYTAVVVCDLS